MKSNRIKSYLVGIAGFADKRKKVLQKGGQGTLEIEISEMIPV